MLSFVFISPRAFLRSLFSYLPLYLVSMSCLRWHSFSVSPLPKTPTKSNAATSINKHNQASTSNFTASSFPVFTRPSQGINTYLFRIMALASTLRGLGAPPNTCIHENTVPDLPTHYLPQANTVHAPCAPPATAQHGFAKDTIYFPCDLNGPDENTAVLDACSERPSSIYSDTHATVPYRRSSRTSSLTSDASTAPAEHIFSTQECAASASRYVRNPYSLVHVTRPVNAPTRTSLHDPLVHCLPPTVHDSCSRDALQAPIFTAEGKSSIHFPCDGRRPTKNGVVLGTCSERSDTRATVPCRRSERSSSTFSLTSDAPTAPIFTAEDKSSTFSQGCHVHNPHSLEAKIAVPTRATVDSPLLSSTSGHANPILEVHSSPLATHAKDAATVHSNFDTKTLNDHNLQRSAISGFVPERSRGSLEHAGGDLRTYAQHIDVRNIPTGRHNLAGQVCEDLLSYVVDRLFWDEAKPDRRFVFLRTNLKIQVSAPHPTKHVAEVVFSWSHSQGPAGSSFANITLWLSKTLRTGIKNFGRRYRVLFDVDGVIWWGENPTNAAAHWEDLDRYLKENAELRQDETKKERSRRFGWMPLSYLIIKCHYVEPTPPPLLRNVVSRVSHEREPFCSSL